MERLTEEEKMVTVKNMAAICVIACGLTYTATAAAVSPTVADYGDVSPILTERNLENVFRTYDPAPWYVSFNLTDEANVALGVRAFPPANAGTVLDPSFIRIVTFEEGIPVANGTDTFTNPFADPIDLLVAAPLSAGKYALEVNGFGNRTEQLIGPVIIDAPDFTARLQVMPIPEPETYAMLLAGLGLIGFMSRHRKTA
jgi:PEP-CTERM motif